MFWLEHLGVDNLREDETVYLSSMEYIMKNGILRQKEVYSQTQKQTKEAFDFKWKKREIYESSEIQSSAYEWLLERYLDGNIELLSIWLKKGARVLDAGCGSGFSSLLFFGDYLNTIHYLGVDISTAIDVAVQRFEEKNVRAEFFQADLGNLPFREPTFDLIFSEGVLHHTDSTEKALKYLSTLLLPGGRFLFYVYKKKGPIREFTDDYIRNYLKDLEEHEAWETLLPLSKLGEMLGDLNITIDIPEKIPYLEIPAGPINLQRLFYWHIFKAYYKPNWTIDEMNIVNYDWFRPLNCRRHSPEEIKQWCNETGLEIEKINVQESGITVVAKKIMMS